MKKIISFLLLAAMLVGCMIPAVIVSAAEATLTAESVEKLQGTGTEVVAKVELANNPGIYSLNLVVYYNSSELKRGDVGVIFEGSVFSADDSAVKAERNGTHNDVKNSIPEDLRATSKGYLITLAGLYDDELGDTLVVTEDGIVVNLPFEIIADDFGEFDYTVVAVGEDADGNEVEFDPVTGTVSYVQDELLGKYDEFTVFTDPATADVVKGTTSIDIDIRYDNNPGLWSSRMYVVYPAALTLTNGDAEEPKAKVENSGRIYTNATDLVEPKPDVAILDQPVATFQDVIAATPELQEKAAAGYISTVIYYEPAGFETVNEGDGVLCTLHFDISPDVEVGDVLDVAIYYGTGDFLYAGTDPDTKEAIFVEYTPDVFGAELTIIDCQHTETTPVSVDATCGAEGYTADKCVACDTLINKVVTPATGIHNEGDPVVTDSTCSVAGKEVYTCQDCGNEREVDLDLAEHTPGAEATCTTAQTCTECGAEIVAVLGHEPGTPIINNPTCTEDGSSVTKCDRCGETISEEVIEAEGHIYLNQFNATIIDPTCTEKGYTIITCDVCGEESIDPESYVDALGHDEDGDVVVVDSTCTVPGTKTIYCSDCGEISKVEDLELAPHTPGDAVVVDSTCSATGTSTISCEECGEVLSEDEIAKKPHTPGDAVVVDSTCTATGTSTISCEECGEVLSEDEIAKKPHTPGAEATCTTAQTCTECGEELVAALGHTENDAIIVEPTYTEEGSKFVDCKVCGETLVDEVLPVLTIKVTLAIVDAEGNEVYAEIGEVTIDEEKLVIEVAALEELLAAEYPDYKLNKDALEIVDGKIEFVLEEKAEMTWTIKVDKVVKEEIKDDDKEEDKKEENKKEEDKKPAENKAPQSGDNMFIIVVALSVVLVAAAAIVIFRRKRSN